jgi:predicted dehydrogenase
MPLKIAIMGTGNVARDSYLPYLSTQKDLVLSYYSRTRQRAEACAGTFGGRVADSIHELLADEPDAVLVLTRETERFAAVMELLEGRPKRLFFEKPLVAQNGQANVCEDDFLKARELLQRANAAGTETAMIFNYRFFDQTLRAKKVISDRNFGELTQASLYVHYNCWSHCIDLLHLFGGRASQVSALAGDTPHEGAVDVSGSFRLLNGSVGTILGTSRGHSGFPLYDMILNFERGSMRLSDLDGPMEIDEDGTRYREAYTLIGNHSRWDQYHASFHKSLAAYLDSIRRGDAPPVPGLAGLEELQFEVALRRSVAQRRPVDVQQEFSLVV